MAELFYYSLKEVSNEDAKKEYDDEDETQRCEYSISVYN